MFASLKKNVCPTFAASVNKVIGASGGAGTTDVLLNHLARGMDPLSSVLAPRAYHQGKEADQIKKDLVGLERCRYCIRSVCALNIPNNTRYPGCKNYKPEEEGKVSCLYCNRRPFKTARAVIQHQVARHRYLFCPKVPHKTCSGCGQTFQSEQLYNNHVCAWPLKKKEPWPVEKEDLNEEEDVEMESSNEKK